MMQTRHRDLAAVSLLVAAPALFFFDVLRGARDFFIGDLTRYYRPAKILLRRIVLDGEFPYWNPYISAGQPLAANPEHEVFYPPNWLIFLPSFDTGFRLLILFHLALGLVAMYALLRSLRAQPLAAFAGALSFGLGGILLSSINLLPILFCAAWLPLTCLYARRAVREHRLRDFALAAMFLGLQFLAGEPSTLVQTAILVAAYATYRCVTAKSLKPILLAAAIGVAGLAAGAAQMLPAIDHARHSVRARGIPFSSVRQWSMPPSKLAELVYPNFHGHVVYENRIMYWGGAAYGDKRSPFLFSIYAGLLVAVMALTGIVARMRGWLFVTLLAGFFVLLALGANTPLLKFLYDAGLARFLRYYEKFAFSVVFLLIVFATLALDRVLSGDARLRRIALIIGAALTIPAIVFSTGVISQIQRLPPSSLTAEFLEIARRDWIVAAARGVALILLLAIIPRIRPTLAHVLLVLFVIADLAPLAREIAPTTDAELFAQTPRAVGQLQRASRGRPSRIFPEADWYSGSDVARQYARAAGPNYALLRNGLFPLTPAEFGLQTVMETDYDFTTLLPTADFTRAMWQIGRRSASGWPQPMAAMSNAWFRGMFRPFEWESQLRPIVFVTMPQQPRYYFADGVVKIGGVDEFVSVLTRERVSPSSAFVSGSDPFTPAPGVVHALSETANTVRLDVESKGRAFLVMSVTPHKYWRIEIDGREQRAVRTNIGYQGIEVAAGRHIVTMRYRNPLILIGVCISIVVTLILVTIAITMRAL